MKQNGGKKTLGRIREGTAMELNLDSILGKKEKQRCLEEEKKKKQRFLACYQEGKTFFDTCFTDSTNCKFE